jgi:hypothetical protein
MRRQLSADMCSMDPTVGLCATCVHHRVVRPKRGSVFWYCRLSETDSQFPKYPLLPVLRCGGYECHSSESVEEP